jgi:hypothetical protein
MPEKQTWTCECGDVLGVIDLEAGRITVGQFPAEKGSFIGSLPTECTCRCGRRKEARVEDGKLVVRELA